MLDAHRYGSRSCTSLRGRVGRGSARSYCILIAPDEMGDVERLQVLAATEDGFRIAEEDLRLRGEGEFAGTQQAGGGGGLLGSVMGDFALYMRAKADADGVIARDPELRLPEHQRLRALLDAQAETRAMLVSS
jgi:ATP-dependent DNA helicase RecG